MNLQMVKSECTFAYFASVGRYLERRGNGMTQFGRALQQLNIELNVRLLGPGAWPIRPARRIGQWRKSTGQAGGCPRCFSRWRYSQRPEG